MSKIPLPTETPKERAFLVGVELRGNVNALPIEASLDEMVLLSKTAGLDVVGRITQRLRNPNPKTFVGKGKIEEIRSLVEEEVADIVLFDDELSPRHQRELEKYFGNQIRVVDRTALILDIFAIHANTREGALQVELAQYEYRLPRLTRAWTHLARQAGGGGGRAGSVGGVGLRGPGETQIEVDRREIRKRIAKLRSELEKVRAHRKRYRSRRKRAAIPTVALVGYTNAGKSTLMNKLSDAGVLVADELFATLDPTTRRVRLPDNHEILVTDTVGFIQKLPTTLVAAFRATLEEIVEADLLLHVVDISHPQAMAQKEAVDATLNEIQAGDIPIVTALNKVDRFSDPKSILAYVDEYERAAPVSALHGHGVDTLMSIIEHELFESLSPIRVRLPYKQGRLIGLFHEHANVDYVEHKEECVILGGKLPSRFLIDFREFTDGKIDEAELVNESSEDIG